MTEEKRTCAQSVREITGRMRRERDISLQELGLLLATKDREGISYLAAQAREETRRIYGNDVYIRGLIEFTNYCRNDCYYCGIRRSSSGVQRYRLTQDEILSCCEAGYGLGFRTFVLQGGEDLYFTDDRICALVSAIKDRYPDCAVTLSVGERPRESYRAFRRAGADRYLLRHETADGEHYRHLHPPELSCAERIRCLRDLKECGFQTGCGFMAGSPGQTVETLYKDLQLIRALSPEMVGIGPFIPQKDTPFGKEPAGTLDLTLRLLSIIRLLHPRVLLPATTALGTIHSGGREMGILAGANVVMPNLSPVSVREKYMLYDNKICTGDEAAECLSGLRERIEGIGYRIAAVRGDYPAEADES